MGINSGSLLPGERQWRINPGLVPLNAEVSLGLTASHLLANAEEELLALRNRNYQLDFMRGLPSAFGPRPPTEDDFRSYIEDIKRYDATNANVIQFEVGVANLGEAPADDVTAEFWFPDGFGITNHEPEWPRRPAPREFYASQAIYRAPHPLEQNTAFTFDWSDDGRPYARIRVGRLMQSTRVTRELWATVADDRSGFPIEARVLVASPALTIATKLNVRVSRNATSRAR